MTDEKEWWREKIDRITEAAGLNDGSIPSVKVWLIPLTKMMVEEAETRGKMKAWEEVVSESGAMQDMEFRSITKLSGTCSHKEHLTSAYKSACEDMQDYAEDKLTELKKI